MEFEVVETSQQGLGMGVLLRRTSEFAVFDAI